MNRFRCLGFSLVAVLPIARASAQTTALSGIKLTYSCGNNFRIRNATATQYTLTYTVYRTGETNMITIPAKPDAYPYSETYLLTNTRGAVALSYNGARVAEKPNGGLACPAVAATGYVTAPTPWMNATAPNGIVGIHAALLPNGKVLSFGLMEIGEWPQIWDPKADSMAAQDQTQYPVPRNKYLDTNNWNQGISDLFCAGQEFLSDGRLLVVGGHDSASDPSHGYPGSNHGLDLAFTFDYRTNTWTQLPNMHYQRWYPSVMILPDGEALVNGGQYTDTVAGDPSTVVVDSFPEIFNPNADSAQAWRVLTTARDNPPGGYYPWMFVMPNGNVFAAGEPSQTRVLSNWQGTGTGTWGPINNRLYLDRSYGSAVMYDTGKVLVMGGGFVPASQLTAEIIDLNAANPTWTQTASLVYGRRMLSAGLMADGKVLVSGGGTDAPPDSSFNPTPARGGVLAYVLESWDPATQQWSELAALHKERLYHSNNLLLPDGRMLVVGSGDPPAQLETNETNAEFFYPPYLYNPDGTPVGASRPIIMSAPANVTYGQVFSVQTQNVIASKVLWIKLGSVTHAFNEGQRAEYLSFTQTNGTISATAPANANLAPPGFYLMFVLNARNVPSAASIVQIQ